MEVSKAFQRLLDRIEDPDQKRIVNIVAPYLANDDAAFRILDKEGAVRKQQTHLYEWCLEQAGCESMTKSTGSALYTCVLKVSEFVRRSTLSLMHPESAKY